jgi:hypothetical protein
MRLSRLACGVISGSLGVAASLGVSALESRFLGYASRHPVVVFLAVGGAVFWFFDWLGLVSTPYTQPPINLHGGEDKADAPPKGIGFPSLDIDDH